MGRSESRKHPPSSTYRGRQVERKKSTAFTFLCSFVPAFSPPTLRLFGRAEETTCTRRRFVRGNPFWPKIVSKRGDRINSSKTKEAVEERTFLCLDPLS